MRKRLLVLALLLVGGAIVNVAVAWGCAAWLSALDQGNVYQGWIADAGLKQGGFEWLVSRREAFGSLRVCALPVTHHYMLAGGTPSVVVSDANSLFPHWCRLREAAMRRNAADYAAEVTRDPAKAWTRPIALMEDARGWPCLALWSDWDFGMAGSPPPSGRKLQHGFELQPCRSKLGGGVVVDDERALPYIPLWPGFAINTLFYAAILWLLFVAPFALRRRRRITGGLCPACAYPVGESNVCTECGAQLPSSSR